MSYLTGSTYINSGSKTLEEINQKAYIIRTMTFNDPNPKCAPHEIAFIVSRERGHEEFLQVAKQNKQSLVNAKENRHSKYGKDLLRSCFKGW